MAKFAFINIPFHAHINPTLPVVQELVNQGHDVVYYLTEKYKGAVEATGAKFYGYESEMERNTSRFQEHSQSLMVPILMIGESLSVIPQILESVRAEQPDCLIYSDPLCFSGRFIAQILGLAEVASRVTFIGDSRTKRFFQTHQIAPEEIKLFRDYSEQLCARYPIASFTIADIFMHKAPLNIVFLPRSFQINGDTYGEGYCFVGPSIGPRARVADFPFEKLGKDPIIYITLGTVYNDNAPFFRTCFAAFADLPVQVVIGAGGRSVESLHLGPQPANFLVRDYVPQVDVMKRASLLIGTGSSTTLAEAMFCGLPIITIPQSISQEGAAKRVAELGLGLLLEKEAVTVTSLRDAAMQLLRDPAYRQRALQMQKDALNAGGAHAAAEALRDFVCLKVESHSTS
ncbi:MAG TPA: macrolide family glycosyltransferase [Ktedonosporobacter sp.]|nr:macrolide family glycosyltransferase [Ktedonosporobacter sp.]